MQSTHDCGRCFYCEEWPRWCCDKCSTHNTHVCFACWCCREDWDCNPCGRYHKQFYKAEWSSGDEEIDSLINECNKITINNYKFFEWIPFERFTNVEYLAKGGFATIYKSDWLDGPLNKWDHKENKFKRWGSETVVLKTLNNTKQITPEFRNEVKDKTFECGLLFFLFLIQ